VSKPRRNVEGSASALSQWPREEAVAARLKAYIDNDAPDFMFQARRSFPRRLLGYFGTSREGNRSSDQPWRTARNFDAHVDIAFQCPYAVPIVLMLTTHPSHDGDILGDQSMQFSPPVDARDYFDPYGNICTRLVAPPGLLEVRSEFVVEDSGLPDEVCPAAHCAL
jgi:hypothetical protein